MLTASALLLYSVGVGVSLAIVAVLFALLCFCGQFPQCGQLCCSKGGRPSKYGETRFEVEAQHSHYPNDPENNLQMQPYEPTDASGREGALHHVSELGARPAPQPRRERNHERRDRPRRDQSDRLGALAAAHGSHGRMASQETLVDRPSENRTDSEVLPETKDITD